VRGRGAPARARPRGRRASRARGGVIGAGELGSDDGALTGHCPEQAGPSRLGTSRARPTPLGDARPGPIRLDDVLLHEERRFVAAALERSGGRVYGPAGAAAALGLKPSTLQGRMRRLGLRPEASP